jgi:hypothetical protein
MKIGAKTFGMLGRVCPWTQANFESVMGAFETSAANIFDHAYFRLVNTLLREPRSPRRWLVSPRYYVTPELPKRCCPII